MSFEAPAYGSAPDVSWTTADLCDAYPPGTPGGAEVLPQPLLSFGGRRWYFGEIVMAGAAPGHAFSLVPVLSQPGRGRVLMASPPTGRFAVLGDRMAALAVQNGWAGVVIDGYVRDVEQLLRLPLGVHALGSCPNRAENMVPAQAGNCAWPGLGPRSGHWIYADADGIVVLSRRHAPIPPPPLSV